MNIEVNAPFSPALMSVDRAQWAADAPVYVGVDAGSARGDFSAVMVRKSTAMGKTEASLIEVRSIIDHLKRHHIQPTSRRHTHRRSQSLAYHNRIQKKWDKRFGLGYIMFCHSDPRKYL